MLLQAVNFTGYRLIRRTLANQKLKRKKTGGDLCSKVTVMPEIDLYSFGELDSTCAHLTKMNGTPSHLPIKLDRRVKFWSIIAA